MDERELKERLSAENEDFRKIVEEHRSCGERLDAFKAKSFLTEEERVEEKELKKQKLALKDRMYQMMAEYKKSL